MKRSSHKDPKEKYLVWQVVRESRSGCLLGTVLACLVLVCGILLVAGGALFALSQSPYVIAPAVIIIGLGVGLLRKFVPTSSRVEYEVRTRVK